MARSSIFHNIVINDPAKADAFVAALEASEADTRRRAAQYEMPIDDRNKARRLLDAWRKEV